MLRASVTVQPIADPQPGDEVLLLVDGSDTPVTANGLSGYVPQPGDRVLIERVGQQIEVVQFLSVGTVPFLGGELGNIQAELDLVAAEAAEATNAASAANDELDTYKAVTDENLSFLQAHYDVLGSLGDSGIDTGYFWVGAGPNEAVKARITDFVQEAVGAPTYQQFAEAVHVWDRDQIGDIENWTPPKTTFYDVFVANGYPAQAV